MPTREAQLLALRRAAAARRMTDADRDRIARAAEGWADEDRVSRLVRRLDALHPAAHAHAASVPCDWRECAAAEPSPNRAGDA